MMRLTIADQLQTRRAALGLEGSLRDLMRHLRSNLEPLMRGDVYLPEAKPLLSRDGGVCAADGARLQFDPWSPHAHRCPQCDRVERGERHDRAWIWRYHLWLSERAVHLALLAALGEEPALADRASHILTRYATLYPTVPNRDNVLGPSHLFFSTYLESIWLLQIVVAAVLLDFGSAVAPRPMARAPRTALEPIVAQSAGLIASFDEGFSNRQVWNSAANVAAAIWLDRRKALRAHVNRLKVLLAEGVTSEGLWYEGENYHLFALRGFLLGAELARWAGDDLYADRRVGAPLAAMYEAPLATLLPDLTLPARGDAPYGVSIQQPRFAELWELGWARTGASRLEHLLVALYAIAAPERDDTMAELAEQETNRAPLQLRRDRLGWKALLWARPDPPRAEGRWRADSQVLDDAGLVVLRPSPQCYVSLECGGAPGGHGHPDVLHLTLFDRRPRFADLGTGSYVSPSLHWYRSTLAHNAPGLTAVGQTGRDATCVAIDARDEWAWCRVEARDVLGVDTRATRSLIVTPTYVLDVVEVAVPERIEVELALHPLEGLAQLDAVALAPRPGERIHASERPGPPSLWFADGESLTFLVRRASGSGTWVQAYARHGATVRLEREGERLLVTSNGVRDRIEVSARGAEIRRQDGTAIVLEGRRRVPAEGARSAVSAFRQRVKVFPCVRVGAVPQPSGWEEALPADTVVELGKEAYRRAEEPWGSRGPFRARCIPFIVRDRVGIAVRVIKSEPTFRPREASDPALDNEAPDIHSDGLQWYVDVERWAGWVMVPQAGGRLATRIVAGTVSAHGNPEASWSARADGYAVVATVPVGRPLQRGDRFRMTLVVNEIYPDRERRAGQLVWGGGGDWVYLRGDRESPHTSVVLEVV